MFCGNCGAQVDDSLNFCPHCGAKMYKPAQETPQPEPQPAAQPVAPPPAAPQAAIQTAPSEAYTAPQTPPVTPIPQPSPAENRTQEDLNTPFERKFYLPSDEPGTVFETPYATTNWSQNPSLVLHCLRAAKAFKDEQQLVLNKIDPLEKEEKDIKAWLNDKGIKDLIFAVIAFVVALLLFFFVIRSHPNDALFEFFAWIMFIFEVVLMLGALAASVCFMIAFIRKFTRKGQKQQRLQEIELELRKLYRGFQERLDNPGDPVRQQAMNYTWLFPTLKVTAYQIDYMTNAIETGRARNFQEALLNYDNHVHQLKMENIAIETAEYARRSAAAAESAAAAAQQTASNTASMNQTATRMWSDMQ